MIGCNVVAASCLTYYRRFYNRLTRFLSVYAVRIGEIEREIRTDMTDEQKAKIPVRF